MLASHGGMLKGLLKRVIPRRIRLWRYNLYEKARYYPELLFSLGTRLECPFCGGRFRRMRPSGFDYPVLTQNRVIGAAHRPNVVCPRCKSHDRERLLLLFVRNETRLMQEGGRVLHVAPEPQMRRELLKCARVEYLSMDLTSEDAMVSANLLQMPLPDNWFDAVICNHVLEHVSDDRRAMREIRRILKPGGWAILQAPIALALRHTIEDPSVTSEQERIRRFGQRDHVRMYSTEDYPARLKQAGLKVSILPYARMLGDELTLRHALVSEEMVYFCQPRKRGVREIPPPRGSIALPHSA
jgi:SAM-dependent methyltransferase